MVSKHFERGGYSYIKGVFQYSAGVASLPGYRIERVRFSSPVPLEVGFRKASEYIKQTGRPLTSMCACELRSPAPFSEEGFTAFNKQYVGTLSEWGLLDQGDNPVARSNVCPVVAPPSVPSFYAFSFTVAESCDKSFVVSGSGEVPEGKSNYQDHLVAKGNVSKTGMREKARWVLGEMERRLAGIGMTWRDVTVTQVYTVHDLHHFLQEEIVGRGAADGGLTWHLCRPPVVGLEYEMDCRGLPVERVLKA
jgi:enamine deaminase RidA (YjgF/YER057c/UK114 family)